MDIILVRHGESEHNAKLSEDNDSALTKKGRKQAEYVGKKLQKIKISKIYTSGLIRAKQTAQIISKINKISKIKYFDGLNEYPGRYLKQKWRWLFNKRLKLLKKLIKDISKDKKKDKTILIVAHGITNRIIIGYLLQIPLKKQLLFFRQHNTGVNILIWDNDFKNWKLESMNDISHLPERLR
ncbi:MAG: histidine phosphatase family protein [Candidatus Pacearchaeota archaeon]